MGGAAGSLSHVTKTASRISCVTPIHDKGMNASVTTKTRTLETKTILGFWEMHSEGRDFFHATKGNFVAQIGACNFLAIAASLFRPTK